MILGLSDPVSRWVVLAVLCAVALGILALLWLLLRAICRRLGVRERTRNAIAVVLVLLLGGAGFELWRDKLDDLERTCHGEFMKSAHTAGATDLEMRKHVNLWKGWSTLWGYTEPLIDPRVMLWIWFSRDGRKHYTLVTCRFAKVPVAGGPPQLRFEKLDVQEPRYP